MSDTKLEHLNVGAIRPRPNNPRAHSKAQIKKIAASIKSFGFRYPVLIDAEGYLISGHGRLAAAKSLGMDTVPVLRADDLSEDQVRALMIADNRLTDLSDWDDDLLAEHLEVLVSTDLDFDIEDIGFDYGEIEMRIERAGNGAADEAPAIRPQSLNIRKRAQTGDVWALGTHKLICGDALDPATFEALMGDTEADVTFTDPPYNLKPSEISQLAQEKHGAFEMGSGELSRSEFVAFLETIFANIKTHSAEGATGFVCMDWRHIGEVQEAGDIQFETLRNLCVWSKDRPGMGSLYRSQHELVFVWQIKPGKTANHVQLGANGRTRSNIWDYPSALSFKAEDGELADAVQFHPTVKPVAMIADALRDVSRVGDIVLDPFLGSGSTLLAAEQMRRVCRGIEISPDYVDLILARWEQTTGVTAKCLNRCEDGVWDHAIKLGHPQPAPKPKVEEPVKTLTDGVPKHIRESERAKVEKAAEAPKRIEVDNV